MFKPSIWGHHLNIISWTGLHPAQVLPFGILEVSSYLAANFNRLALLYLRATQITNVGWTVGAFVWGKLIARFLSAPPITRHVYGKNCRSSLTTPFAVASLSFTWATSSKNIQPKHLFRPVKGSVAATRNLNANLLNSGYTIIAAHTSPITFAVL
jgi:hypothetical protein